MTALLGPTGRPIDPRVIGAARMSATIPWHARGNLFPYEAQNVAGQELSGWFPSIRSPDGEINFHRDRVVARERDLVRNDGWATGAVNTVLDSAIGAQFRLVAEPDYAALSRVDRRLDDVWADEFAAQVESEFRLWGDDPSRHCDATRQQTLTQILNLALRHKLIDGDALIYLPWLPELVGAYGARYATTVQILDPDRLSNPFQQPDTLTCRGGVEIDGLGAPLAYHVRRAYPNDWYGAQESMVWDRVPRETVWGRPVMVHDFDRERAGQNRGMGVLAPVLARFKMLGRYDAAELQQAVLQTVIRTFIESPMDHDGLRSVLAGDDGDLGFYQRERLDFAGKAPTEIGGVRVPRLFPGEKIGSVAGSGPSSNFPEFEHAILRSIAAPLGTSAEQISKDYSRVNYSSARSALMDAWKSLARRRHNFETGTVRPIYCAFLEEAMEGRLAGLMPKGAPAFWAERAAYSRCQFIGPARGWVDPVKERQGAVLGLDAGFSTLKAEAAQQGLEWREVIRQRALEIKMFKEAGIPLPTWSGTLDPGNAEADAAQAGQPAAKIDAKPQPQ